MRLSCQPTIGLTHSGPRRNLPPQLDLPSEPLVRMESPMSEAIPAGGQENNLEPVPLIDLVAQHQEIESEVAAAVSRVFTEQKFILGDEVAELEFEIAGYCDAREAIGCASGTDALLLAMMALDIGPGDEVFTGHCSFFTTGSSI